MSESAPSERDIFVRARELSAEERPGYLLKECGSDVHLRRKVEKLLEQVLDVQPRVLGPQHPDVLQSIHKLASCYNGLAWLQATSADPAQRDPVRAVEQARKALELAPQEGAIWNTLGVAQYRAGNWSAPIKALKKSIELRKGGDSFDWFFLAMTHWQLAKAGVGGQGSGVGDQKTTNSAAPGAGGGQPTAEQREAHKAQARHWYQKAVAWMEKNEKRSQNEELRRFRAEAEALMGLDEMPIPEFEPEEGTTETLRHADETADKRR